MDIILDAIILTYENILSTISELSLMDYAQLFFIFVAIKAFLVFEQKLHSIEQHLKEIKENIRI